MARVFKRKRTVTVNGKRTVRTSRAWYVQHRDAQGIRRTVKGYPDKQATQQLASELEKQAAREASGLVDRFAEHRKRPLSEHVGDYERTLRDRGLAAQHVRTVTPRIRKVLDGCRFVFWSDLSASRVQAYIAELRESGRSVQTCNFYLQAAKQFCRWKVQDGRAPESPLTHLQRGNVRTDRRGDRRALTGGSFGGCSMWRATVRLASR